MNEEKNLEEYEELINFLQQKKFVKEENMDDTQKYSFNENGVDLILEISNNNNFSQNKYLLSSHNKRWIKKFSHSRIGDLKKNIIDIQMTAMPAEYIESAKL